MGLILSRNEQHKLKMQAQAEADLYQQNMARLSDEFIDWCIKNSMSVADFENLYGYTKRRFEMFFGKTQIDKFKIK